MIYVCAWCGAELPQSQDDGTERVSHGICEPCAFKMLPAELHDEYRYRKQLEQEGFTLSADRVAMGRCF